MENISLQFIEFVKDECKKYGVVCSLRNTKYVRAGKKITASGYFDESVPTLVCAVKNPNFLPILVHEYCHLTQWVEGIPLWKKAYNSMLKLENWLSGEDVKNIKRYLSICRDLELDNEKRSVKIIKKYNLPIDIKDYTKRANAYVQFYNYLAVSRKWCNSKNTPYNNRILIEAMPSRFSMDYTTLPKKIEKIFIDQNI
jgi:hypothetical protein